MGVRIRIAVPAYCFMKLLATGTGVRHLSERDHRFKMGGRMVRHARRIIFQLADVAIPEELFAALLGRIARLGLAPG